jgi:hypothetical protein
MPSQPAVCRTSTFHRFFAIVALCTLILVSSACGGSSSAGTGGTGGSGGGTGGTGGGGTGGGSSAPRAFNGDFAVRLPAPLGFGAATSVVYDQPLKEVFVSDPPADCLTVYSSIDGHFIASLGIPGASGLSLAPDNSTLYVGTLTSYFYSVDPVALRIKNRVAVPAQYVVPNQSGNTDLPNIVFAMADGSVFIGVGPNAYASDDASFGSIDHLLLYEPASGTFTVKEPASPGGTIPARSLDGTALLAQAFTDDNSGLSLYTTSTKAFSSTTSIPESQNYTLYANANGSQFAVLQTEINAADVVLFYDANLQLQNTVTLPNVTSGAAVFSRDGSKLYVQYPPGIVAALNTQTGSLAGYLGFTVAGTYGSQFEDIDENNHLFGLSVGTLVAFNASQMQSAPPAVIPDFTGGVFDGNAFEGPPSGGTAVGFIPAPSGVSAGNGIDATEQAYFGSMPATQNVVAGYEGSTMNALTSTSPATTTPGPVSVVLTDANGDAAFLADGFSYGPHILRILPNAVGSQGGDTITITAYGLGFFSVPYNAISIGGTFVDPASIQLNSYAGDTYPEETYTFKAPAGKAGWADVKLTALDGSSATLAHGVQYLQTESTLTGNPYTNAAYDKSRDRFYLTGADQSIAIYDVATNALLDPLTSAKISSSAFLSGLALTPDDSKLVVVDTTDRKLIVFDLTANTSTSISTVLPSDPSPQDQNVIPGFVQVAANNIVLVEMQFCSPNQIREVDLVKGTVKGRTEGDGQCGPATSFPQWGEASGDGSVVLLSGTPGDSSPTPPAGVWEYHSANDSITGPTFIGATHWQGGTPAVNLDGSMLINSGGVLDQRLLPLTPLASPAIDDKLNDSGSLLEALAYFPLETSTGLLIMDTHTGGVLLSAPLPSIFGANVTHNATARKAATHTQISHADVARAMDEPQQLGYYVRRPIAMSPAGDKILYANISGGLTYLQLSVVPLAVGTVSPATASAGSPITVRGSGFVAGTTVKIGGQSASCSMSDSETLACSVPGLSPGAASMSLTNPDGQAYSFDFALVVQ